MVFATWSRCLLVTESIAVINVKFKLKQKQPGYKKVQGQSEAALYVAMVISNQTFDIR